MNFEINEEQGQLHDSIGRLLAASYSFEQRRAIVASETGWSPAVWQQLGALGITALRIPGAYGGFGGSAGDLLPILQQFGKGLLVEPFLASTVLGATALSMAGDDEVRQRLLPHVASAEIVLAWAHDEDASRHAPLWVESSARQIDGRWRIDGSKCNVLHGQTAQHLIVTARIAGGPADRDGLALFRIDAKGTGLHLRPYRLIDDTPAAELRLDGVIAEPLGNPLDADRAWTAIDATLSAGTAAVCADAVGAMEGAYALTVAYLNTRKQFGRLLGANQALRHRVAEMMVDLEVCKSMAMLGAAAIDDPGTVEPGDLMRAKLIIGRRGRSLCHSAIQLHGGIGMTEEYAVGHYLRRIAVIDQLFGDSESQASRLADMESVHG